MEVMNFTLKKPVDVSIKGDFDKVYELTFCAPSYKHRKEAAKLSQVLSRAEADMAKMFAGSMDSEQIIKAIAAEKEKNGDKKAEAVKVKTAKEIKDLLFSSSQDIGEVYDICVKLFCSVCFVADGVNILASRFNDLDLADFENMCFEYIAFFISPR